MATSNSCYTLDGYSLSCSGVANTQIGLLGIAQATTAKVVAQVPTGFSLTGGVGGVGHIDTDDANMQFTYADRMGFGVANLVGTMTKTAMTAWGRTASRGRVNESASSNLTRRHGGGT